MHGGGKREASSSKHRQRAATWRDRRVKMEGAATLGKAALGQHRGRKEELTTKFFKRGQR